jgi:rod shape-determining protein MreD
MKSILFYGVTLFGLFWFQVAINNFIGTSGFSINIVLIAVLYFGLARGPMPGQLLGFFWGLLLDASSLGLIGLHSLLFAATGYFGGMLRRQLDENKIWTQTIFTFGISFLYVVCYLVLERIFAVATRPPSWSMAAQPFINAAAAPLLFWLIQRWAQFWDMTPRKE